jgi:hypothetical protein
MQFAPITANRDLLPKMAREYSAMLTMPAWPETVRIKIPSYVANANAESSGPVMNGGFSSPMRTWIEGSDYRAGRRRIITRAHSRSGAPRSSCKTVRDSQRPWRHRPT